MRRDREVKALACKSNNQKGIPDLLRSNLTYLFQLGQADNYEDDKSPLAMSRTTTPLADGDLLRHRHHMLTRHLLGLDPALQKV